MRYRIRLVSGCAAFSGDSPVRSSTPGEPTVEVTQVAGGTGAAEDWDASAIEDLDVPVVQALTVTMSRERWEEGGEGLLPVDAATQVAIPEFDGRIIGGPISFKERDATDSPVYASSTNESVTPVSAE